MNQNSTIYGTWKKSYYAKFLLVECFCSHLLTKWCLFTCVYMVVHIAHDVKILPRISFLMVQQLFKCCCRLWRRVVSSKVKKSFFNLPLFVMRVDTFISFKFTVKLQIWTSLSCLESHAGFFRVYGKCDVYLLWSFWKKLKFILETHLILASLWRTPTYCIYRISANIHPWILSSLK